VSVFTTLLCGQIFVGLGSEVRVYVSTHRALGILRRDYINPLPELLTLTGSGVGADHQLGIRVDHSHWAQVSILYYRWIMEGDNLNGPNS